MIHNWDMGDFKNPGFPDWKLCCAPAISCPRTSLHPFQYFTSSQFSGFQAVHLKRRIVKRFTLLAQISKYAPRRKFRKISSDAHFELLKV